MHLNATGACATQAKLRPISLKSMPLVHDHFYHLVCRIPFVSHRICRSRKLSKYSGPLMLLRNFDRFPFRCRFWEPDSRSGSCVWLRLGFRRLCMSVIREEPRHRRSWFGRVALLESFNFASDTRTEGLCVDWKVLGVNQHRSSWWQLHGIPRLLLLSSALGFLSGLVNKRTMHES